MLASLCGKLPIACQFVHRFAMFCGIMFLFPGKKITVRREELGMERTEKVELTVLCLVYNEEAYLLQDRIKEDWKGYTLPGGHVEPGESIVDAVVREMKEETGLTIRTPRLCGVKQFPIEGGRYIVFLFRANQYEGELLSSEEGAMHWISKEGLSDVNLVNDFNELLQVILDDTLNEFQYVLENDTWNIVLK